VNDNNRDVYNLFNVVLHNKDDLIDCVKMTPLHTDLLGYWKNNVEKDPVVRATRFLFLSNYCLYGKTGSLRICKNNPQKCILDSIDFTFNHLFGTFFLNCDFRDVLRHISFSSEKDKIDTFVYADPPYINTANNYSDTHNSDVFTEEDSYCLFDVLENCGCKFAMSEFDSPFIINEAKRRNLNVIIIGSRRNINNSRTEILVTNYQIQKTLF